jgi:capsular polysaccharide biosynthesis protein
MARPYIKFSINEITELVNKIDKSPQVMKDVVAELKNRKTAKARALFKKLTERPYIGSTISEIVAIVDSTQDKEVLAGVINELMFRKSPQSKALLKEMIQ